MAIITPELKRRFAEIAAPYKACAKKLGLKYKNYDKFKWSTKAKVRRCVGQILRKRRKK